MCGIAGYRSHQRLNNDVLEAMVEALNHRGPDSCGFYNGEGYVAGMRRLAINDVNGGDQPLRNESNDVILLYNGEIYNYPELRRGLEKNGHKFSTRSDGEVICHLWEEQGIELFSLLDGMFAVALWITKERKLILARDMPGEKPLYYSTLASGEVVFASEIKSLIHFPKLDLELDPQAIWDFPTFLWVPEPNTIFTSIKALPAGHLLEVNDGGEKLISYQNKKEICERFLDETEAIDQTRQIVTQAVKSRLLSDVPMGSFLSGGLDSSIVAKIARTELNQFSTFTIGFENLSDPYHGKADEAKQAEYFAKELNTKHHTIRVTANTFRNLLPDFCHFGDQPFAVSSGLGVLAIAKAAHEAGIKVLLTGDGADECFGGYSWYEYLPGLYRSNEYNKDNCIKQQNISFQNFGMPLENRLRVLAGYSPPIRAWAWHYYASENEKATLFSNQLSHSIKPSWAKLQDFKPIGPWSAEEFIAQDRAFYFPQEMLRKADRMTMAYSVEGRVPFASPSVLAHSKRLGFQHMVRGGELKWVLRNAFKDDLPKELISRPKHGFNVPIDHWLKNEWSDLMGHTFSPQSRLSQMGMLNKNSEKNAQAMLHDKNRLNGHAIFCFIMLNMWLENFGT